MDLVFSAAFVASRGLNTSRVQLVKILKQSPGSTLSPRQQLLNAFVSDTHAQLPINVYNNTEQVTYETSCRSLICVVYLIIQ